LGAFLVHGYGNDGIFSQLVEQQLVLAEGQTKRNQKLKKISPPSFERQRARPLSRRNSLIRPSGPRSPQASTTTSRSTDYCSNFPASIHHGDLLGVGEIHLVKSHG
jgi:hypothetical protein